jgi:cytidine deaminase
MKTLELKTIFTIFESADELPETVKQLMRKAVAARQKAYAPYSKFNVGAALLLEDDEIVTGNNQENAAYPAGLCAERVAIYYAGAKFPDKKIKTLAISAASDKHTVNTPIPPCGACRQALAEYEIKQNSPIAIYFMGETGSIIKADSLKDMLPFIFEKSLLI